MIERIINGTVYQFDDGTPEPVIQRFIQSKSAPSAARPTTSAPAQAAPEPFMANALGQGLQGLTMGFSDEAIARARALGGDRSYEDYVKAEREGLRKHAEQNPRTAFAAELTGALAPALITGGMSAVPELTAAAGRTVGPKLASLLFGQSPSLARMAGVGAGSGAITALGTTEKAPAEWGGEALRGGVAGGATAGALGLTGKYILMPAFNKLRSAMGFGDAGKMADVAIARALEKDGMTPDQALAKLQSFSRGEATLADLGENTTALLRRASAAPGEARTMAKTELAGREAGRIPRISDDLRTLMSGSKDFYTDVVDLIKKRASDADPLYQAAWDSAPVFTAKTSPDIARLQNLPSFKKAMEAGMVRMKDQAIDVTDPKNVLRGLHETKLALDDMIENAMTSDKGSNQARILMGIKDRLVKGMEEWSPEYKVARETFAGDSELLTAMKEGQKIYQLPELEMRKLMDRFKSSPSEYDAFRAGIAQSMLERLRAAGPAADPLKSVFTRDSEQKLRRAFQDEGAFDEFARRLKEESGMLNTEKAGFRKTPIDTDLDQSAGGVGAAMNLFSGRPVAAAGDALRAQFPGLTGMPPRVATPVTAKLLSPSSQSDQVLQSIMTSLKADEARLLQAAQTTTGGAGLAGGLAATRSPKDQYPENDQQGAPAPSPLGSMAQ